MLSLLRIQQSRISLILLLIGVIAIALIMLRHQNNIIEHQEEFRTAAQLEAEQVANNFSVSIKLLYQGLRTIARLPGTRTIDRYARNLNKDARSTMQELYNNLYSNISLSEVYIVPVDFDPDVIDPHTHLPGEPIIAFDQFIAGRHAESAQTKQHKADIEEIEIYEYKLMKEQLAWFKIHYPNEDAISSLNYPAISGPEVITCDNSYFSPSSPDNRNRSGLVYSVPFYDDNGVLKGMISGVVLTRILKKFLPDGNYALVNTGNNYVVTSEYSGLWEHSLPFINSGLPDNSLLYSQTISIPITDNNDWKLWVGRSYQQFEQYSDLGAYRRTTILAVIAVILFLAVIQIVISQQRRQKLQAVTQKELLELKVEERTKALTVANSQLISANNAKASFLSRVSHELRTPLNAIIGYSELMLDELKSRQPCEEEDLTKILNSGKHLLELINEVLDISKIEAGKMEINLEEIDIRRMIDEVTQALYPDISKKGNQLSIKLDIDFATLTSDKMKLKQILLNLLSNANKFTQKGGIKISLKTYFNENKDEWLKLQISDTGIGMMPDKLEHIFEEFFQAHDESKIKERGTGLGLAICAKLTELLHGDISVQSTPNFGSTFTLSLPRYMNSCILKSPQYLIDIPEPIRNVS